MLLSTIYKYGGALARVPAPFSPIAKTAMRNSRFCVRLCYMGDSPKLIGRTQSLNSWGNDDRMNMVTVLFGLVILGWITITYEEGDPKEKVDAPKQAEQKAVGSH